MTQLRAVAAKHGGSSGVGQSWAMRECMQRVSTPPQHVPLNCALCFRLVWFIGCRVLCVMYLSCLVVDMPVEGCERGVIDYEYCSCHRHWH